MKIKYSDILDKIPESPIWFDSNGTPRYNHFHPKDVPCIYADEAALILIGCQACGQEFKVSLHHEMYDDKNLSEQIPYLYYGDPPNVECCSIGPTMSSDSVRVLEFWIKEKFVWIRKPELEIELNNE